MDGYEKLIKTIREESSRAEKGFPLKIGVMKSPTSCLMGQIELEHDDIYIAEHLTKNVLTELDFKIENSGSWTDKSKYINPLKTGDLVLIVQISSEKYAIIERMVEL